MTDRIEKKIVLRAPRSRVWRAIANGEELGSWFGVRGLRGAFQAGVSAKGQIAHPQYDGFPFEVAVERVEPERYLSWRWHPYGIEQGVDYAKEPTTLVEFQLEEVPGGTQLTVVESGFERIAPPRRERAFKANEGGWAAQLQNIERHVSA
jgi:uncharacterized protein YndB with AHSA1/START domain